MKRLLLLGLILLGLRGYAQENSAGLFPVRGFCIAAPNSAHVDKFVKFIHDEFAPKGVNTLILRVDYNYQFSSHPELSDANALSSADVKKILAECRQDKIKLIPLIDLLGHQSWAGNTGKLLRIYPELDETPWVEMPKKYKWPNADNLYCKSYCPLHPKLHAIIFDLIDEICDAFESNTFHAGMDEVFYIGEDRCPRCGGKDKAELFAGEVTAIHDHLQAKGRKLWIWGDRLIDGKVTGIGEWEGSYKDTARAVDLIPKDVVICDWHYDRAEQTEVYFALKGFSVITCTWKSSKNAIEQINDIARERAQSNPVVKDRLLGITQTVWEGAEQFMSQYEKAKQAGDYETGKDNEARCFVNSFNKMNSLKSSESAELAPAVQKK